MKQKKFNHFIENCTTNFWISQDMYVDWEHLVVDKHNFVDLPHHGDKKCWGRVCDKHFPVIWHSYLKFSCLTLTFENLTLGKLEKIFFKKLEKIIKNNRQIIRKLCLILPSVNKQFLLLINQYLCNFHNCGNRLIKW